MTTHTSASVWCAASIAGACAAAPPAPFIRNERNDPIDLHVTLLINGSQRRHVRDGELVVSGDRLQLLVKTREDSHLYLAYCTGDRVLEWFPLKGSIEAKARVPVVAPAPDATIVFDDNLGQEALYVVVSRLELRRDDLARSINISSSGGAVRDCGQGLAARQRASAPAKPRRARKLVVGGHGTPSMKRDQPEPFVDEANTVVTPQPAGAVPLDVTLVRGGKIVWNEREQVAAEADSTGVTVLRYGFIHDGR